MKHNEKYGINLPITVEEATIICKASGNKLLSNVISKDITYVKIGFEILDNNESVLHNHQFFKYHMIFDVKLENLRQKARLVVGKHMTKVPTAVTYASVLSRETVCIVLTISALN